MAFFNDFKEAIGLFKEDHRLNTNYKHIDPAQLLELAESKSTEDSFWEAVNYRMQNRHVNLRHNTPEQDEIRTLEILSDAQLAYYTGWTYAQAMGISFIAGDSDNTTKPKDIDGEAAADAEDAEESEKTADIRDSDHLLSPGLYQYMTQPSRIHIPLLAGQLKILHADRHAEHFEKFISEQGIRLRELDSYTTRLEHSDPQEIHDLFTPYNDVFHAINQEEDLKQLLKKYVIEHVREF